MILKNKKNMDILDLNLSTYKTLDLFGNEETVIITKKTLTKEQLVILNRARELAIKSYNGAANAEELYELELLRIQIKILFYL